MKTRLRVRLPPIDLAIAVNVAGSILAICFLICDSCSGLIEAICDRKIRVTGELRAHTTGADAIGGFPDAVPLQSVPPRGSCRS